MKFGQTWILAAIFFLLGINSVAAPAHKTPPTSSERPVVERIEESFIDSNIVVSKWINTVAEGLDLWLAGQQYTDEKK